MTKGNIVGNGGIDVEPVAARVARLNGGGSGVTKVELDFPNDTTRYCVGLVRAIEGLVGAGRVDAAAAKG